MPEPRSMSPGVLTPVDDLRHPPVNGSKGRDSLYFNLMLPEHDLGVFVYTWVDHNGIAGRLVTVWGTDEKPLVFNVVHGLEMGGDDFDDWNIAGLTLRHPKPLRSAEVRFNSGDLDLAY